MEDAKAIGLKRSDFEIMAPAGSRESLHAAIAADSVYFGVEGLNMRSRSSANFNLSDLREIAALCNEHGVKSYLTLNTVVFDSDLDAVAATLDAVAEVPEDWDGKVEICRVKNVFFHGRTLAGRLYPEI